MKLSSKQISDELSPLGLKCDNVAADKTLYYIKSIISFNSKINLISKKDEPRIFYRHFIDSLQPLLFLNIPTNASILDLGSGAGLPSIPIKIIRPDLNITAYESITKKAAFISKISSELSLQNFKVINKRLTNKTDNEKRFDFCVSRAVSELRDFVKNCSGHIKDSGKLCTFKHINKLDNELTRFSKSRYDKRFFIEGVFSYTIKHVSGGFRLVVIKKRLPHPEPKTGS